MGGGKLYPKTFLHHATVLEILSDREDDSKNSLQYLVDFAPKNSLQIETAFKLLVLRTQVPGVIRHEIVHKTFTSKYATSGLEFIGEVKRKSILEAVLFALNSSSFDDEEDKNSKMNTILYEAVDRVSEEGVLRVLRLAKPCVVRKRLQRFRKGVFEVPVKRFRRR